MPPRKKKPPNKDCTPKAKRPAKDCNNHKNPQPDHRPEVKRSSIASSAKTKTPPYPIISLDSDDDEPIVNLKKDESMEAIDESKKAVGESMEAVGESIDESKEATGESKEAIDKSKEAVGESIDELKDDEFRMDEVALVELISDDNTGVGRKRAKDPEGEQETKRRNSGRPKSDEKLEEADDPSRINPNFFAIMASTEKLEDYSFKRPKMQLTCDAGPDAEGEIDPVLNQPDSDKSSKKVLLSSTTTDTESVKSAKKLDETPIQGYLECDSLIADASLLQNPASIVQNPCKVSIIKPFDPGSFEMLAVDPAGVNEDSPDRVKLPPLQIALADPSVKIPPIPTSFTTATGREVEVDPLRIEQCAALIHDDEPTTKIPPVSSSFTTATGKEVEVDPLRIEQGFALIHDDEPTKVKIPPVPTGFTTATGKEVEVDPLRIEQCAALIHDDEPTKVKIPPVPSSFTTATGKGVEVDPLRIEQGFALIHDDEPKSTSSFSTASGKNLKLDPLRIDLASKLLQEPVIPGDAQLEPIDQNDNQTFAAPSKGERIEVPAHQDLVLNDTLFREPPSLISKFSTPFRSVALPSPARNKAPPDPSQEVHNHTATSLDYTGLELPANEAFPFPNCLAYYFETFHQMLGEHAPQFNGKWFVNHTRLLIRSLCSSNILHSQVFFERLVRRSRVEQHGFKSPIARFLEDGIAPVGGIVVFVVGLSPMEISDGWCIVQCECEDILKSYLTVGMHVRVLEPISLHESPVSALEVDGPALKLQYNGCEINAWGRVGPCFGHPGSVRHSAVKSSLGCVSLMDLTVARHLPDPNEDQMSVICMDTTFDCSDTDEFFAVVIPKVEEVTAGTRLLLSKVRAIGFGPANELRFAATKNSRIRILPPRCLASLPLFPSNIAHLGESSFVQTVRKGSFVDVRGAVLHIETLDVREHLCVVYIVSLPSELICRVIAPQVNLHIGTEVFWPSLTFDVFDAKPRGCAFDVFLFNGVTSPEVIQPNLVNCHKWRSALATLIPL